MDQAPASRQRTLLDELDRHWIALTLLAWVGTAFLHLHPWVPLVPAVFLAAIVTFVLNRFWVFS